MRLLVLLACSLIFSSYLRAEDEPAAPPEDIPSVSEQFQQDYFSALDLDEDKDWIQLDSGEVIQGELEELYQKKALFDSDELDDLSIDIEDIQRLRTAKWFQVNLRGLGVVRGRLMVDEEKVTIVGKDTHFASRYDVISVYQVAESEADRWENKATLSANIASGNTNTLEINGKLNSERKTALSRTIITYLGVVSESNDETTARNHRVTLSHDLYKHQDWFFRPVLADFYHAPLKNIKLQSQLASQVGYIAVEDDDKKWELSAGPSWQQTRFEEVTAGTSNKESSLGLSFGSNFEIDITKDIELNHDYQMTLSQTKTGGYQHHNLLNFAIDITDDLDLDIDFIWDYTASPTPDADDITPEKNDYRVVIGIGLDF
ncbi:DUF481 domain-containing protein [Agarivorans sp. 1_MG-2023]|uniref:DUF481 domain-containing protein n=1 Tax=Agarivorans sp. 1_MG-2023 TaxID=3062634 RepID=UPI0026E21BA9|nr:DUF481 domain-containing protein [Agarivorans sp. 1_MG-2023]MDO6762910.1 DUF481 domain-containing protein [Agarivorans sp. 1_MG-2023]